MSVLSSVPLLRAGAAAGEVEDAAALEEEVALLREEQAEAREVDLLLVDLDLREVGVDGEVGGQVRRDAVLDVAAESPSRSFRDGGVRRRSVVSARDARTA